MVLLNFVLFALLAIEGIGLGQVQAATGPRLYGLTRVKNGPHCSGAVSGCTQLVSVDEKTGTLSNIGHGHTPIAPVGDLGVIDSKREIYYYLGDGWNGTGTVLYGIGLQDGGEVCRAYVKEIGEVGIVGGGQSMVVDASTQELVIAGLATKNNGTSYFHKILSAPMQGGCGPFKDLGTFQDGDYEPMAHGSAIDPNGHRLFVTLSTQAHAYGLGIASLPKGTLKVLPMSLTNSLWGPVWVGKDKKLYGVASDEENRCIAWRSVDPDSGKWTSSALKMAAGSNTTFNELFVLIDPAYYADLELN